MQGKTESECELLLQQVNAQQVDAYQPVIICLYVTMVLGLIGNPISIYIFYFKFEVSSTQIFLIVLCITNFLACLLCIPMKLLELHAPFTFNITSLCPIGNYICCIWQMALGIILAFISFDRYFIICQREHITAQDAKRMAIILLLITPIANIPALFLFLTKKMMIGSCGLIGLTCTIHDDFGKAPVSLVFLGCILILGILIIVNQVIVYTLIVKEVCRMYHLKKKTAIETTSKRGSMIVPIDESNPEYILRKQTSDGMSTFPINSYMVFLMLSSLWVVLHLLKFVTIIWREVSPAFLAEIRYQIEASHKFLMYTSYMSQGINPFLYVIFCQEFRLRFKNIFVFKCNRIKG